MVEQGLRGPVRPGRTVRLRGLGVIAKLAWKPAPGAFDTYAELRLQVLHAFRDPEGTDNNQLPWPWIYGDAMAVPPAETPRQNASLSPTQYAQLTAWAAGEFVADWNEPGGPPRRIEDVPLAGSACNARPRGARVLPGRRVPPGLRGDLADPPSHHVRGPVPDPPPPRRPARARLRLGAHSGRGARCGGPLYAQGPGDLTRWMGLPWQADTGFCRSGYTAPGYTYDPYLPTFWPARVPNQVLTEANYSRGGRPEPVPASGGWRPSPSGWTGTPR